MEEQCTAEVTPLSKEGESVLNLMQAYIDMIRQHGGVPDTPEFDALAEELYECLSEGLPHEIEDYTTSLRVEEPKPELASQEQLAEIWERLVDLARDAKPKRGIRLGRKADIVERRIYLVNLPNWERWQALLTSETTVTITPSLEDPEEMKLDLINFSALVRIHSVFGRNTPFSLAAYVSIRQREGRVDGSVGYLFDLEAEMKVLPDRGRIERINIHTHSMLYEIMTAEQADTLLSYIPVVEKKT
jgi:hypothetical protein